MLATGIVTATVACGMGRFKSDGQHQRREIYAFAVFSIEVCAEVPFRRMEALPGTEFQVDYGTGVWIVGADGKRRKTHLFRVVVLSFSRKAYSEVSFTQETEFFLRALENAFRYFGGVTETVVIDNLKAGILKPCVYDKKS